MEGLDVVGNSLSHQSVSAIHHALRSSRRRLVVLLVANRAFAHVPKGDGGQDIDTQAPVREAVSVRELAREIVCIEEDVSQDHASGEKYHNVYSALIQSHLPRLDDISAIDYNEDRKLVTPDYNLAALATIAAVSSPVAQMLFHTAIADLFAGGSIRPEDAISD